MNYSVNDYIGMIGDTHRTGAYVRALRKMVTPDSVVLDLGAGFGFFAVLAARLGARHAYAIEPNGAIALGPALARANGVADRVTFFHGDSRDVSLPERANLLIEDVRGTMPLHVERIKLLCDARERLLTADARLVAVRDRIWAAPARHDASVQADFAIAGSNTFGVDLSGLRSLIADASRRAKTRPDELVLPGALVGLLDLATVSDPNFEGTAHWSTDATLVADGFVVWFDAELAVGESFSAKPGPRQTVHSCLYLPLREPLSVPARADLSLRFCAIATGGDYLFAWEAAVAHGDAVVRTPRQSTLGELVLTPLQLAAKSERHQPQLGRAGRRVRAVISLIEHGQSSGEIAAELAASAEHAFSSEQAAFDWLQQILPLLNSVSASRL